MLQGHAEAAMAADTVPASSASKVRRTTPPRPLP
jgi:hypothetical protein